MDVCIKCNETTHCSKYKFYLLISRDRRLVLSISGLGRYEMMCDGLLLKQSAFIQLDVDMTSAVSDSRLSFKQLITSVL